MADIVTRDEWLVARRALLAREKELTRLRDAVSAERRTMPWVRVDKDYVFDGPDGRVGLADLFDGRSQLIVYHFMFAPGWAHGCPSCSFLCDNVDGVLPHLAARDVSFAAVSRASLSELAAFRERMGWGFRWVSSGASDFNRDFNVSFSEDVRAAGPVSYNFEEMEIPFEELHGLSVFVRDAAGDIFHSYSSYARGGDVLLTAYAYLDLVPKGRDEDDLAFPMAWVRHHDRYADPDYRVDPAQGYAPPPRVAMAPCCAAEG